MLIRRRSRGCSKISVTARNGAVTGWTSPGIAVVRAMHTSSEAHTTATFYMNTGVTIPGSPSMGAWTVFGLGTENQNLPAFVVLPDLRGGVFGGSINWSSGYLPAYYQGTLINSVGDPIVDLQPPEGVTKEQQQRDLTLLNELNAFQLNSQPRNPHLLTRMKNYELAFRTQTAVPPGPSLGHAL
jgi:hypothetical protein